MAEGRYPANLILSHSLYCTPAQCIEGCPVKELDGQSGILRIPGNKNISVSTNLQNHTYNKRKQSRAIPGQNIYTDTGGASKCFNVIWPAEITDYANGGNMAPKVLLYNEPAEERLPKDKANSVDSLVVDVPSSISFMGAKWDNDKGGMEQWIQWLAGLLKEAYRVLKPGAYGLVWALPRTSYMTGYACALAGFEVKDCIYHIFAQGMPKGLDISKAIDKKLGAEREILEVRPAKNSMGAYQQAYVNHGARKYSKGLSEQLNVERYGGIPVTAPATELAKQWEGFNTRLKPAVEVWWLIQKPLEAGTYVENILEYGTGALNIGACRIATSEADAKAMERCNTPGSGRMYASASPIGTFTRSSSSGALDTTQGRYPANLILSHAPACQEGACVAGCPVAEMDKQSGITKSPASYVRNVPTREGVYGGHLGKNEAGKHTVNHGDEGGASRYFNVINPEEAIPFVYCSKASPKDKNTGAPTGRNPHPTAKSTKLMAHLIKLITPPGGWVLDFVMGSGSTGVAAVENGFNFIGIEMDKTEGYFECAQARIDYALNRIKAELEQREDKGGVVKPEQVTLLDTEEAA